MSETPVAYHVQPQVGPVVPVMQCPVAGFQYHGGETCWAHMRPNDPLVLRREPGNPHDSRAITVMWREVMLGYVPREANYALSQMMDGGAKVVGRVLSMRAGGDPWQRVMMEVTLVTSAQAMRPEPAAPAAPLQASTLLVRSLANRIFGASPPQEAQAWVEARAAVLALVGVEHPGMLPFLRIVHEKEGASGSADPLAALHELLRVAGIKPAAWKRLPRWGLGAFEGLGTGWVAPVPVARLANLLLELDVQAPPPREFASHARFAVYYRTESGCAQLDFNRHPLWFMRALLRGTAAVQAGAAEITRDLRAALDWLIDARPAPDANQQHAGWDWIVAQARAHREALTVAASPDWEVPFDGMIDGQWQVVPIRTCAELYAEARAMRNCLEDYEADCRSGEVLVFSIRDQLTGARRACFSVARAPGGAWELEHIAGKHNAEPGEEMRGLAEYFVARMELIGGRPG